MTTSVTKADSRRISARVRILLWLLAVMAVALAAVATTTRSILLRDVDHRISRLLAQETTFRFEELLARVRLRLRTAARAPEVTVLRSGDLSLDLRTRRARAAARTVDLTAREFVLLELFLRHPGQVLSREQILSHVWGYDFDPGSNIVDVYVRALRMKLGAERLETVRGMGYRMP